MTDQRKITLPIGHFTAAVERADRIRSNGFEPSPTVARLEREARNIGEMLGRSTPPEAMQAAPVAPARGTMRLQENYVVAPGGTRRADGAHWQEATVLRVMVEQMRQRHEARNLRTGSQEPFASPFTPGQLQVAEDYRALVEWREGSAMKCGSLDGGASAGAGSGLFIDTYIDRGSFLARIHARIGDGVALSKRRAIDQDNVRRTITARRLVDMVCLEGKGLSGVLIAHRWTDKVTNIRALRDQLIAALDRMQGYRDTTDTRSGLDS